MLRIGTNDPRPLAGTGTGIGPKLLIPVWQPGPMACTNRDHRGFFSPVIHILWVHVRGVLGTMPSDRSVDLF
jgi:hypothetical protein